MALDGDGRNSPYAEAFLEHIEVPGLELGKLFRKVRDTVYELTDGYQEPFTYGSLPGRDIFLVPAVAQAPSITLDPQLITPETGPKGEREQFAQRMLREAIGLDDEEVKLGTLQMISRLYPDTRAGQYAQGVAGVISSTERKAVVPAAGVQLMPNGALSHTGSEATIPVAPKATAMSPQSERGQDYSATQKHPDLNVEMNLNLSRSDLRGIQRGLNAFGFSVGPVDGIFGTRSRTALRSFQDKNELERTGYLTAESVAVLKNIKRPELPTQHEHQTGGQTLAAMPKSVPNENLQNVFYGDYLIELKRQRDPQWAGGKNSFERPTSVLRLVYRKSAAGFQLVSAHDYSKGGTSRRKKYRASLSDEGKLRISGSTGFLFGKTRVARFLIKQQFSTNFIRGQTLNFIQGRFDDSYRIKVTITRR